MLPPSVHETGESYRWANGLEPGSIQLAEPPRWLLDLMDSPRLGSTSTSRPLLGLPWGGVPKGQRNTAAASLAGTLFWLQLGREEVLASLLDWNRMNEPPMSKEEVAGVVDSIGRRDTVQRTRRSLEVPRPGLRPPERRRRQHGPRVAWRRAWKR